MYLIDDVSHTEILAWPFPPLDDIPSVLRDAFDVAKLTPRTATDADDPVECLFERSALVHDGDAETDGPFLRIVDEGATEGIVAYRVLLDAFRDAGINYHATNDHGDTYPGAVEQLQAGVLTERRSYDGEVMITESDLFTNEDETRSLSALSDETLGARARAALSFPDVPRAARNTW